MKTKVLTVIVAAVLGSSYGFASNLTLKNVLGRQFCQYSTGHLTGWGFAKDGIAYNIDSFAGMPSPYSFFQVEFIMGSEQFVINEYSKKTKVLIYQGEVRFEYDLVSDELRSGDFVLNSKQCGSK